MRTALKLALVALSVVTACKDTNQPPVVSGTSVADSADQMFLSMKTLLTTKGVQRADLTADTAYVLEDQTKFDLREPHVIFNDSTGARQGTMESKRGVYSTRSQTLEGWGDVVVKMVDGRTLKTPHVIYNQLNHTVTSDTSYTITRGTDVQSGMGFTADQSFFPFTCLKACKGSTTVKKIPDK
ncbi:MAG TPA: LPS export ABC transporter periplasmic protein LptC [Gemmatimonadaceae bacterium]|jgi:LPS export ABC transporter protein LptC